MQITIEFSNGHQYAYEASTVIEAVRQAVEDIKGTGLKIVKIYR